MTTKPDAIAAERDSLPGSKPRRLVAPLRGMMRGAVRWPKHTVYLALRPLAHWAKPMLLQLAQKPAARKLVIRVFGRHSSLVNTARLFLVGAPVSSSSLDATLSPEMLAEGESLSARGREILSTLVEMRAQARGEAQRASRT